MGDTLILTKAVGTGTLTGALKNSELSYEQISEAITSMKTLNKLELSEELHAAVHAATDVTGFGVLGHALHIAQGSGLTLNINADAIPLLDHAEETLGKNILTKAHKSNTTYVEPHVQGRESLTQTQWWTLVDPQTSGGLLLSVAREEVEEVLAAVRANFPRAAVVGEVVERREKSLVVS